MDITEIPFNKYLEIQSAENGDGLELVFKEQMKNHIGTFHASGQVALAEACSGLVLQRTFPEMEGAVVPVLRKVETKFKKPVDGNIRATGSIKAESKEKFLALLEKKGRSTIDVSVEVMGMDGTLAMTGRFEWFVQKM